MATTTKCPKCSGMILDKGDGEPTCANCGRMATPQESANGNRHQPGGLVINLEIRPKTLPELISGLAAAEGKTPVEYLKSLGLPQGQAIRMKNGEVIYPAVAVALMEKHGITASDFVALMKSGTVAGATTGANRGGRPGGTPRGRGANSA